jgi:hypothetical protein
MIARVAFKRLAEELRIQEKQKLSNMLQEM